MKKIIVFVFSLVFGFVLFAQDAKIGTSILPPSEMRDVNVTGSEISVVTTYDVFISKTTGEVYKKFSESYIMANFPKEFSFSISDKEKFYGSFVSLSKVSAVFIKDEKGNIKEYSSANVSASIIAGENKERIYVKIVNPPENFYKILITCNFVTKEKTSFVMVLGVQKPSNTESSEMQK